MCLTGAVSVAWCSDFTPRLHIPFVKMHITAGAVPSLPSRALITINALQPWPLKGGERQLDWWPVPGVFLPLTSDLWERPQFLNRDSRVYNAIYFFLIRPYNPPAQEKKASFRLRDHRFISTVVYITSGDLMKQKVWVVLVLLCTDEAQCHARQYHSHRKRASSWQSCHRRTGFRCDFFSFPISLILAREGVLT